MSFDELAKNWDADHSKVERAGLLAQKIIEFSTGKKLKKALEFGCGTGLVSFFLKDEFNEITLADTSSGMIEVLKEKIRSQKITNFNPILLQTNEELKGQEFNVIYSLMAMHHVKDLSKTFDLFNKILKPGGYLIIGDLVKEDGDFHHSADGKQEHNGFVKEELIEHLEKASFTFLDYQIFYTMERTTESGIKKKYPLFLLRASSSL